MQGRTQEGECGGRSALADSARHLRSRFKIALLIGLLVDLLQLALFPWFIEGDLSTLNAAVDAGTAIAMMYLLGWDWAFLPTFVAESLPGIDLFPTWTAAVLYLWRKNSVSSRQGGGNRLTATAGSD